MADAWEPPDPLAVPADLCDRVLDAAAAVRHPASDNGNGWSHHLSLDPDDEAAIRERFAAANALWWELAIDTWTMRAKRYGPGDRHRFHQDLHPGAARRKLAGSVQLSDSGDYAGGDLTVHFGPLRLPMPRARGTLVALPGWSAHEVEPVTRGERWALIVTGWGPPLR